MFEDEPRRIVREHMENVAAKARRIVCPKHGSGGVTATVVERDESCDVRTECCCETSAELVRVAAAA